MDAISQPRALSDRRYFAWATALIVILVFAGFSRTYYLKFWFGTPPLSLFLHIHGAIMTGWIVFFVVQTVLISLRRVTWHRFLGWFGAAEAMLVVIVGAATTLYAAAREVRGHTEFVAAQVPVLALELTQITLFAIFVAASILRRNRVDYHKRLILLATICLLANPIVRLPIPTHSNLVYLELLNLFAFLLVAIDTVRRRSVHPAFAWGFSAFLVTMHVAYWVAYTQAWMRFASRLVS